MHNTRYHILFYLMIIMLASLFFSRSVLAISMLAFFTLALVHNEIKEQLNSFFQTPLLWGMSLLFFIPFISGLWSEDKHQWLEVIKTKSPLLFFPLAFASHFRFSTNQWRWLCYIFIFLVLSAATWSVMHYVGNSQAINASYLEAKTLVTPLDNDHVRFSWLVFAAIFTCAWLYYVERSNRLSWILLLPALILTIYLHLLAARTGLLAFYLSLGVLAFWLLSRTKFIIAIVVIAGIIILPVISYFMFPSFKNKVLYFNYEWNYFKEAHYLPHANDAVRVISIKAGWNIMMEHPTNGVGYGDVLKKTRDWYIGKYPGMEGSDQILPSSQWVLFGTATGIGGALLFLFCMVVPFFSGVTYKLPWWVLNLSLAIGFFYDIALEVQFGVFIYSFFILWYWQWLKPQKV